MATYVVDPARSTVTAVTRPMIGGDRSGPWSLGASGAVEVVGEHAVGAFSVTFEGDPGSPPVSADIDLDGTAAELAPDLEPGVPDGTLVLRGRTTRPAGAFGLAGPPLLNPTIQISWRLVLAPG